LAEHGSGDRPYDIVIEGQTPGGDPDRAAEIILEWETAGATWWIESWWGAETERTARLRQGPPR
jgi:hypothetical protein